MNSNRRGFYLERQSGGDSNKIINFMKSSVLGRDESADIKVVSKIISRKHCFIEFEGDRMFVTDLNGPNGTYLNDTRIVSRTEMKVDDLLGLGCNPENMERFKDKSENYVFKVRMMETLECSSDEDEIFQFCASFEKNPPVAIGFTEDVISLSSEEENEVDIRWKEKLSQNSMRSLPRSEIETDSPTSPSRKFSVDDHIPVIPETNVIPEIPETDKASTRPCTVKVKRLSAEFIEHYLKNANAVRNQTNQKARKRASLPKKQLALEKLKGLVDSDSEDESIQDKQQDKYNGSENKKKVFEVSRASKSDQETDKPSLQKPSAKRKLRKSDASAVNDRPVKSKLVTNSKDVEKKMPTIKNKLTNIRSESSGSGICVQATKKPTVQLISPHVVRKRRSSVYTPRTNEDMFTLATKKRISDVGLAHVQTGKSTAVSSTIKKRRVSMCETPRELSEAEKQEIKMIRSERLREIAEQEKNNEKHVEKNNCQKTIAEENNAEDQQAKSVPIARAKVKYTEKNRGDFLTAPIPAAPPVKNRRQSISSVPTAPSAEKTDSMKQWMKAFRANNVKETISSCSSNIGFDINVELKRIHYADVNESNVNLHQLGSPTSNHKHQPSEVVQCVGFYNQINFSQPKSPKKSSGATSILKIAGGRSSYKSVKIDETKNRIKIFEVEENLTSNDRIIDMLLNKLPDILPSAALELERMSCDDLVFYNLENYKSAQSNMIEKELVSILMDGSIDETWDHLQLTNTEIHENRVWTRMQFNAMSETSSRHRRGNFIELKARNVETNKDEKFYGYIFEQTNSTNNELNSSGESISSVMTVDTRYPGENLTNVAVVKARIIPNINRTMQLFHALEEIENNGLMESVMNPLTETENTALVRNTSISNPSLNESQCNIIRRISSPAFIKGILPVECGPATGKTTVMISTVNELFSMDQKVSVLICVANKMCLQRVIEKLTPLTQTKNLNLIHTGKLTGSSSDDFTVHKKLQLKLRLNPNSNTDPSPIINEADIIVTTFKPAFNIFQCNRNFDIVFVDDATLWSEHKMLPILRFNFPKLVLLGDNHLASNSLLSRILEIYKNEKRTPLQLKLQYRMHREIFKFTNEQFFKNALANHQSVHETNRNIKPYILFDLACNEVDFVSKLAETVSRIVSKELSINILALNASKSAEVESHLSKKDRIQLTAGLTQGLEADIVIILVAEDSHAKIDELKMFLTIGLTRARKALYICGKFTSLSAENQLYLYGKLMSDAVARDVYHKVEGDTTDGKLIEILKIQ